ncbi:MAG: isoprenyl transferase [Candidatus Riflebacteria bacterium]|nr:isoprenyl transferase [Candidatus Riflebacteria bacterium]
MGQTSTTQARTIRDLTLTYSAEEAQVLQSLDFEKIPVHVAAIMDGNGRWARKLLRERIFGHETARRTVRMAVETCRDLGVGFLTLFAFSSENWKRPAAEVSFLMRLLARTLAEEREDLHRNNIRLRLIGDPRPLPVEVRDEIDRSIERLGTNTGMLLSLAINYGGRHDIVQACREIARKVHDGQLSLEEITEELVNDHLYTRQIPDPELLIRTGGEYRVSNFLLWQMAYSELWITPVLWPEFQRLDLLKAIREYQDRERRFGGV